MIKQWSFHCHHSFLIRVFTVPVSQESSVWIFAQQTPTKSSLVCTITHAYSYIRFHKYISDMRFLSSGGADKNVVVFDRREEQIVATLKGHTKKVSSVICHPTQVSPLLIHAVIPSCSMFLTSHVLSLTVGGVFSISRQHHPCVVCYWGQLCAGDPGSRSRCYRSLSACYRRLSTELIWGPGNRPTQFH